MSEEKKVETKVEEVKEEKVEQPKEQLFNQEQVNNIIKSRLESEKAKYQRQLDEQKKAEEEVIKQKQIADAKTKADLEKLMQQRIAEKEAEIQKFKYESVVGGTPICMKQSWNKQCQNSTMTIDRLSDIIGKVFG